MTINQSQDEIHGDKRLTQDFSPRFTCLPTSQSPLQRYTYLEVHELIGITRQTRYRVPHNQHKIGIHKLRAIHQRYLLRTPTGQVQTPHNPPIGAGDNHLPPLNDPRRSKPSRRWQPPRITRAPRRRRSPSATKYAIKQQCTWIHSISLEYVKYVQRVSGGGSHK